jgi:hypothetical protein
MFLRSKSIIPQAQQTVELAHGRLWRNMQISIGSNPTLSAIPLFSTG